MDQLICRTCLKRNLTHSDSLKITTKAGINQMAVKDMLEVFMPEMDLDICNGVTVICFECTEALRRAYDFKNTCLKTEERIYDHLHRHNIILGEKINLADILEPKSAGTSFDAFTSHSTSSPIHFQESSQPENHCDSNQSSVFNIRDPHLSKSENEEKAEETLKSHKSKKATTTRKVKKKFDYNSLKRSYTCDLCEYKTYRLDLLNSHKQKHDKNILSVKEYKCDLCLYSTPRKRSLERHLFTHKGQSQHLCQVCNKPFAEKYQLKLHAITHTGQELPHKCEECGKGFLTKSYLKQHMETRHLISDKSQCLECNEENCGHGVSRYYKCNMCESSFSDKRGLQAHKFTHTGGELPYKCSHCGFATAWKGNLKKHLQNKH